MNSDLTKDESDELKRWGLMLFQQYDLATKRWSMVVTYIDPPPRITTEPPKLAYKWLWEQGLKKNRLALKVLALINNFNKSK